MKSIVCILILTFSSFFLYSQGIKTIGLGVNGGLTYSNITGNTHNFEKFDFLFGYETGLCLELGLSSNLSIETNLNLYQNGFSGEKSYPFSAIGINAPNSYFGEEFHSTQSYLNNSWLLGYNCGKKLALTIQGGFYWAYNFQTKSKGKTYYYADPDDVIIINDPFYSSGYHETSYTSTNSGNTWWLIDPGIVCGIKLSYSLPRNYRISCSTRYYRGLLSVYEDGNSNCNNSFNLNFGVTYVM